MFYALCQFQAQYEAKSLKVLYNGNQIFNIKVWNHFVCTDKFQYN